MVITNTINTYIYVANENRFVRTTNFFCPKCHNLLSLSDIKDYTFQCFCCDEDFYSIEARKKGVKSTNFTIIKFVKTTSGTAPVSVKSKIDCSTLFFESKEAAYKYALAEKICNFIIVDVALSTQINLGEETFSPFWD